MKLDYTVFRSRSPFAGRRSVRGRTGMVVLMRARTLVRVGAACAWLWAAGGSPSTCRSRPAQSDKVVVNVSAERFSFSPSEIKAKPGVPIEFVLKSDDTDHGFRILDTDIDVRIPKRGKGTAKVTFTPKARALHHRVLARLRRRPLVHARHHRRQVTVRFTVQASSGFDMKPSIRLSRAAGLLARGSPSRFRAVAPPGRAIRSPGSRRRSSRSSGSGSTTFSKSSRRRRPRAGVQRHELRRLSQRAGRRRHGHDRRAARRGTNEAGEFIPLDESGETLFQLFSVPGHGCQVSIRRPRTSSRGAFRSRCSAPGSSRRSRTRRFSRATIPRTGTTTASAAGAARIVDIATRTPRIGRFGWKAQHATLLAFSADAYRNEMGITNDLFPKELAVGVSADQMRACDPFPDPEDLRIRARAAAASTTSRASCSSSRRSSALPIDAEIAAGEQVFAAVVRLLPRAGVRDAAAANPLFDRKRPSRCSRISCCTTSAPATASSRRRRRRRRFARPPCGASGSAARSCTTDRPRRSSRRSRATRRSRAHTCRIRPVGRSRQSGAARVPEDAVSPRRLSRPPYRRTTEIAAGPPT